MIDIGEYIDNLPCWHKHKSGHIVYVERYENGYFYGSFWNYSSASKMDVTVTEREHISCLQRGELLEVKPEELAKYLLAEEGKI